MTNPCAHLSAYLDQQLEGAGHDEFVHHLDRCPVCSARVALWDQMREAIIDFAETAEQSQTTGTAAARAELVDRVGRNRPIRVFTPAALRWAAVFTSAVFLLAIGFIALYRPAPPTSHGETPLPARTADAPTSPPATASSTGETSPGSGTGRETIETAADQRLITRFAGLRIGVGRHSLLEILETEPGANRFQLLRGVVAWAVTPRAAEQTVTIEFNGHTVRVIGTRLITRREDEHRSGVGVASGQVEVVLATGGTEQVTTGRLLVIDGTTTHWESLSATDLALMDTLLAETPDSHQPPKGGKPAKYSPNGRSPKNGTVQPESSPIGQRLTLSPPLPRTVRKNPSTQDRRRQSGESDTRPQGTPSSIEQCQTWIIQGRLQQASTALDEHLAHTPNDHRAWHLLADCRRKAGDWTGALAALDKVIDRAPPRVANAARFEAGTIWQEKKSRHHRAIDNFSAYLAAANLRRPLAAEALLRLGRSQLALGNTDAAKRTFGKVITDHNGTVAASRARKMLDDLKSERHSADHP